MLTVVATLALILGQADAVPAGLTRTARPLTFWVTTSGADSANCRTAARPCASTVSVLRRVPSEVGHPVTVNVGAGTYATAVGEVTARFSRAAPLTGSVAPYLWIKGTCIDDSTLATGAASGTSTASTVGTWPTYATVTDAAATWTSGDLRGRFACLGTYSAGTNTCALGEWPIADNDGTSFTIAAGALPASGQGSTLSGLGGAVAYRIRRPGSVFTGVLALSGSLASVPLGFGAQGASSSMYGDFQLGVSTTGGPLDEQHVYVSCLEFAPATGTPKSVRVGEGAGVVLWNNKVTLSGGRQGFFINGNGGRLTAVRNVFSGSGVALGTTGRALASIIINSSNYATGITTLVDLSAPVQRWVSVRNYVRGPTSRTYYHSGVFDGGIYGDLVTGGGTDFVFFGNRSVSHGPASSLAIDGVNWSDNATSQCAIDATNAKLDFDESGVASTGTFPNRNAAVCLSDGSMVHFRATLAMVGHLSGADKAVNYGAGAVLKTIAEVAGATNGVLCNAYSGKDGCAYTP